MLKVGVPSRGSLCITYGDLYIEVSLRFEYIFLFAEMGKITGRGDHDSVVEVVFKVRHDEI